MTVLIHQEQLKLTTSAGSASGNTTKLMGICNQVLVKPGTSSTTYDIQLVNSQGIVVYERTSETGTLSEFVIMPMTGIYTVSLSNATNNELFIIQFLIHED